MEYSIIRFSPGHIKEAATIEKLCFSEPWSEKALEYMCRGDAVFAVSCVLSGGALASYGGLEYAAGEAHIINIATHPDFRRRGLAKAVLTALIGFCRENGIGTVDLEVRESNALAVALYRGAGFSVAGRRPRYYRLPTEDALIMSAVLD